MEATTFAVLGEPSRMRIVELLRERPFAVGDIADALQIRQPQVSKHLGVLRDAGLVTVEAVGRRRIHRLRAEPIQQIADWVNSFERQWETRLDSLGTFLEPETEAITDRQRGTDPA